MLEPKYIQGTFDLNDKSTSDESIKQDGVTINATNGATVNQNSDNNHQSKSILPALLFTLAISIICDFLVFMGLMWQLNKFDERAQSHYDSIENRCSSLQGQYHTMESKQAQNHTQITRTLKEICDDAKRDVKLAKEGNIWLLRHDILRSIEIYEMTKTITTHEWKRLVEEYNHYRSIGGNYDVEGRFETFKAKVVGTREIQMTSNPVR